MSVAIPADELSIDAKRNAKMRTRRNLVDLMINSGKATNPKQVTIREIKANEDMGLTNGTENNEWIPAATTAGTDLTYVNNALGNNKYAGFYGFAIIGAFVRPPIATVRFKVGTGGANVLADLEIQGGYGYENWEWYLDDPIIYQPTDTVFVQFENSVTAGLGTLVVPLRGYLAEPSGQSVM